MWKILLSRKSYIKIYIMCIKILKVITALNIENFFWERPFETRLLKLWFLFELGTFELDEETSGFLEFFCRVFLEFSSNSMERWKKIAFYKEKTSILKTICHRGTNSVRKTGDEWSFKMVKTIIPRTTVTLHDESRWPPRRIYPGFSYKLDTPWCLHARRARSHWRKVMNPHYTSGHSIISGATTATNEWSSGPVCPS